MMILPVAWILLLTAVGSYQQQTFSRKYACINGQCQRTNRPVSGNDVGGLTSDNEYPTLSVCRLICRSDGGLWPLPTGEIIIGKNYVPIDPQQISLNISDVSIKTSSFVSQTFEIFLRNLHPTGENRAGKNDVPVNVHIKIKSHSLELNWKTREDYTLLITPNDTKVNISIIAYTVFGARHALETLSQLIAVSSTGKSTPKTMVMVDQAKIVDKPVYRHRGLLIDTSRNYLSVSVIMRMIDGLAATKMNVLHWHATDSQSFPLYIKSRPQMTRYGAYSQDMIYTPEDVSSIKQYAYLRGIQIILELDSPAHAGSGWEWGVETGLGNLAVCVAQEPWRSFCIEPPCGQLNPVNPNVFDVLRDIYRDSLEILGNDSIIHLGGDEVFLPCWNSTQEIIDEMAERGLGRSLDDFHKLWGEFHVKQLQILSELKNKTDTAILWTSSLTEPDIIGKYLDKDKFIIQTWVVKSSTLPQELLQQGYKLIISTKDAWYLDHGFWGNTKFHSWRDVYDNKLPRMVNVLGGEVCMWGEYVDEGGLDARVWPRAAAAGERLWTDSTILKTSDVEPRLQAHKERLEARDIKSDAMTPAWCAQHATKCF